MPNIVIYSGGNSGIGYVVNSTAHTLCLIICSPKKYFFWAMRLVHPFIGGQKNNPGILYTSG